MKHKSMEVDGSDDFPLQLGDGCRFQPLIFSRVWSTLILLWGTEGLMKGLR